MIEVGSTVEAVVERIEPYGVYFRHDEDTVVVLVPEVSWNPAQDLEERFHAGERHQVRITRFNYRDGVHVGSIRRLHPEENPYRKLSRLPKGAVLHGKVGSIFGQSIQVHVSRDVTGYMPRTAQTERLRTGESVEVTISSLEVDDGKLVLDVVSRTQSQAASASHPPVPVTM